MATNRHAQIRYNTLDKCFRNTGRNYTLDDLLEKCNQAIFNLYPNSEGITLSLREKFKEYIETLKNKYEN